MNTKRIYSSLAAAALLSAAVAIPAFAQTPAPTASAHGAWGGQMQGRPGMMGGAGKMTPGVFGTVSAVSGDSITLSGKTGFGTSTTSVIYTIDATNATVLKNNATSSVASIAVGDTLFVQGTVSGTNVTATTIRDGVMQMGNRGGMMNGKPGSHASSTPSLIQGNGEPVIAGTISAISGDTVTVTNKSNVTYTVDVTSAKIVSGNNTVSSVSNLAVGDSVTIQGTVNGTSVTASTVIDQKAPAASSTTKKLANPGIFGAIGGFFSHLFGF